MKPGDTITPEDSSGTLQATQAVEVSIPRDPPPEMPSVASSPAPLSTTPPPSPPEQVHAPEAQANQWQYAPATNLPAADQMPQSSTFTWSAAEYIAHHKTQAWFVMLGLGVVLLSAGIFLFTHEIISPIMIVVFGAAFGVFAARQPQVLEYTVGPNGIMIGPKLYPYGTLKSFSLIDETGPMHSITLTPLRRFMPSVSLYYEPPNEEKITDILSDHLPFEEAKRDAVDTLMRRVRF